MNSIINNKSTRTELNMNAIYPDWQVPANVHAFVTTRNGGVSEPPYNSFNLGNHVGDDENSVKCNRTLLQKHFKLPQSPLFLEQIHSTNVLELPYSGIDLKADAVYSSHPEQVCLIMTADCLPVLFCSKSGNEVAAAHAGWRGLCDGVLEATVAKFHCPPEEIRAWLGPAIGQNAFQVGKEVLEQFTAIDAEAKTAFIADPNQPQKYLANLYQLATLRLNKLGINQISGGKHCTYNESDKFFSYRREKQTGRMASLIWFS